MFLRGTVTDNSDPMMRGRVRVWVWGVHKEEDPNLPWAEVMGSTAFPLHQGSGISNVIPVGATVWVTFEHNDFQCPIVVGIFVGHSADSMDAANPGNSDFNGGAQGPGGADYGQITMIANKAGGMIMDEGRKKVEMNSGNNRIQMDGKTGNITITNGMASIELKGPVIILKGLNTVVI